MQMRTPRMIMRGVFTKIYTVQMIKTHNEENSYIFKRKIKAVLSSFCFYICRVFPVDKNLVSVCTFEGKGGFCCNPKYLVKAMHTKDSDIRFVWIVDDVNKEFPNYVKKVPNTLLSRAYWLTRSKIWIDNYRKPFGTVKRSGQYYYNVNHFNLGIKCTGLLRGSGFSKMAYLVNKNDSDMIDGLVVDSEWSKQCFGKAMIYDGDMLKIGAPRCDVLYGDRNMYRIKFRRRNNLSQDTKVLMFAPTFREGADNGKRFVFSEVWTIDFERLIHNLENRFSGKWYICIRVHPQLSTVFKGYHNKAVEDRLIDESSYDDMYELLAGMDAYITDYSSAVFEAGYARIPAFIYADDIDEYKEARGNLYWDMSFSDRRHIPNNKEVYSERDLILPFSLAKDNEQLEKDILEFDENDYNSRLNEFHDAIGLKFDGKASERLADIITSKMKA